MVNPVPPEQQLINDEELAGKIAALVVAGKHMDAIVAFSKLPARIAGVPYVDAANAASLAYATLAAREKDLAARRELLDRATATLPALRGRGRVPPDHRQEMQFAQGVVLLMIESLRVDLERRESLAK
ncbi:hypothetical protein ACFLQU_04655 [Verrucomicrobiota bacterium]